MPKEPDSFEDFVAARSRALLRFAWMLTGNSASAEDLLQVALARTWPHWGRVTRSGDPTAYIQRVMVNTRSTWHSHRWRSEEPRPIPDVAEAADEFATVDERDRLRRALFSLPSGQRCVLVLRFFEDKSESETAEILGCSIGNVKSQTARARRALEQILGQPEASMEST